MSMADFERDVMDWANRQVPEEITKAVKVLALEALRGVVLMTPVDTGFAIANWQVAESEADEHVILRFDQTGSATIAENSLEIMGINTLYPTIIIYNNVEYIVALEEGHSKKAPSGMVKVTINRLK